MLYSARARATILGADLNGDGSPDLVAPARAGGAILFGAVTGSFRKPVTYTLPADAFVIVSADFNGDGIPDLAVSTGDGPVYILLGRAGASFASCRNPSVRR